MGQELQGEHYAIVVVAEGAVPAGGDQVSRGTGEVGRQEALLGGIGSFVAEEIRKRTEKDTRSLVLGHLQRGGSPTTFDRLLSLRFGAAAVRLIEEGKFGSMVGLDPPEVLAVPFAEVIGSIRRVPLTSDTIRTAKDIGICFAD